VVFAEGVPIARKAVGALKDDAGHANRSSEVGCTRIEPYQQATAAQQSRRFANRKTSRGVNRLASQVSSQAIGQAPLRGTAQYDEFHRTQTKKPTSNLEKAFWRPSVAGFLASWAQGDKRPRRVLPAMLQPAVDQVAAIAADGKQRQL